MLSKIKSSAMAETVAARCSISRTSDLSDDNDADAELENDSNNNVNNNNNNNISSINNNNSDKQASKMSQDELLDIVEVARRRRLTKESADSLTSFIRWSFSHIDSSIQRQLASSSFVGGDQQQKRPNNFAKSFGQRDKLGGLASDDDLLDDDWPAASDLQQVHNFGHQSAPTGAAGRFQHHHVSEQLLQQHAKQAGGSLALLKSQQQLLAAADGAQLATRETKRARTHLYSPESKQFSQTGNQLGRKNSSYLGNVVERLHQQQAQQVQKQQQQQQQLQQQQQQQELDQQQQQQDTGLSYHLQQFLQQQTSLEDLCSSVGLDDSNQQLVLAAAIHRALVDQVGSAGQQLPADTKSTASSTELSSAGSSSGNNNNNNSNIGGGQHQSSASSAPKSGSSGVNLQLAESINRQRRVYNTRAAIHGLTGAPSGAGLRPTTASSNNNNTLSNRVQQQRHAQAAAALSALANAGSQQQQQQQQVQQQQQQQQQLLSQHHNHLTGAGQAGQNALVDFECDTCGSSFDDRHRLMQHQSIHLELKKDWFNETPVDEVMKIFNRRRGEFLCNTCNLRFEATFDYDKHNHSVHGQRPYCCQFCGNGTRTFRFWRQYLNHLYDHRYIFSCTIDDCDFTVNRRDSLRFHIFRFHLNCQLPQNQHQQLRSSHNLLLGDPKWSHLADDDDLDNEMSVGE